MCEREIANAKRQFLKEYNPERSVDVALSQARRVAVGFNPLYRPRLAKDAPHEHQEIRAVWATYLRLIAARFIAIIQNRATVPFTWEYPRLANLPQFQQIITDDNRRDPRDEEVRNAYLSLISGLRDAMNREFGSRFRRTGFRVSHSQKSISVFLKHLWCMGRVPMPIQCPIDRHILGELPRGQRFGPWTRIDSLGVHSTIISELEQLAGPRPLAVWELLNFDPH